MQSKATERYKVFIVINVFLIYISSNFNFFTTSSSFAESVNQFWTQSREQERGAVAVVKPSSKNAALTRVVQTGIVTQEAIPNYFSYAFKKGAYDVKVVELQKLLAAQ